MQSRRLNSGEKVASISAICLVVLMFLDWFGLKDAGELELFSVGRNAWEALDYVSIVLGITIAVVLAMVVLRFAIGSKAPASTDLLVAILGTVLTLLILYRIVDPPNFGSFRETWGIITIEGTVQFPIFLALAVALGVAAGGLLAAREEMLRRGRAGESPSSR